jgi:integrase
LTLIRKRRYTLRHKPRFFVDQFEVQKEARMALTHRTVQTKGDGWHRDAHGLYLKVSNGGQARSWVFRYMLDGKAHYLGLGAVHTVSLAEAREAAREARNLRRQKIDPIQDRQRAQQALKAEQARAVTFKQVTEDYCRLHLEHFRNPKHRQQWQNTLATHAFPRLGKMIVADITSADVLACVEPIWNRTPETASRVLQRITRVLRYAATRGYRTGDNPAEHVTEALPKNGNGNGHHEAMPYAEVRDFLVKLQARHEQHGSLAAQALEFLILTAARTGEVVGATWDEFDLQAKTWTIPAERMKAGREHRVPLSDRAITILRERQGNEQPFKIGPTKMLGLMVKMDIKGATVHGFRSSFRDWAEERTSFPHEVKEAALAHTVKNKVEAAYRRSDLFEKRRKLMEAWATFCATPALPADVVPLRRKA